MTKISIGETADHKLFHLPADAVTSTIVVFGGKGMGKTNFGSVLVEELSKAGLRWSYLDPLGVAWGLRYAADGRGNSVWLGVSVEDQKTADERIPLLLQTPAAVRWVSYEPALGPVEFKSWLTVTPQRDRMLDWIVAGGESGPGARPAHPDWFRAVRDQCAAAAVPFFFKQWGAFRPVKLHSDFAAKARGAVNWKEWPDGSWSTSYRKKDAGRVLDGREWSEYPAGAVAVRL